MLHKSFAFSVQSVYTPLHMATCEGCFNHIEGCLVAKNIAALLTNTNIPSSDRLKEREKALTTATTDPQTCQNPNYLLSLTGPIQSHGK